MKLKKIGLLLSILAFSFACNKQSSNEMVHTLEDAIRKVQNYNGDVEDFQLKLSNDLTLKGNKFPRSMSIKMLANFASEKGWALGESDDVEGGKIYRCHLMSDHTTKAVSTKALSDQQ